MRFFFIITIDFLDLGSFGKKPLYLCETKVISAYTLPSPDHNAQGTYMCGH